MYFKTGWTLDFFRDREFAAVVVLNHGVGCLCQLTIPREHFPIGVEFQLFTHIPLL